jgi:hypothetical protein
VSRRVAGERHTATVVDLTAIEGRTGYTYHIAEPWSFLPGLAVDGLDLGVLATFLAWVGSATCIPSISRCSAKSAQSCWSS